MGVYITVGSFILFDILTGCCKGVYQGKINSTILREGLFHKLSEIFAVAGSALLEYGILYVDIGVELPILNVVAIYICGMELISIIENLCLMNPKLSKLFAPYLEKLKEKEEKK